MFLSLHITTPAVLLRASTMLLQLLLLANIVSPARILMVPIPVRSHMLGQAALALELSHRGHDVHWLHASGIPLPSDLKATPAVTVHSYSRPGLDLPLDLDEVFVNLTRMFLDGTGGVFSGLGYLLPVVAGECERLLLHNEELFGRLKTVDFDAAVVDGLYMFKCWFLVPHRLGMPWVTHTDVVEPWLVRVPWLPSFVPSPLLALTDRMTFTERIRNSFVATLMSAAGPITGLKEDAMERYRREFGSFGTLDDLMTRTTLWLTSRHLVSDFAKPSMPNMVDVGGLTVKPATKPLPADLAKFVDDAEKGVILATFGSMAASFPAEMMRKFADAFERLRERGYRVVWRFSDPGKAKLPANIWAAEWLPQVELLAHPRVLLFVTHGGNNGQLEAIYHAKPMIGFPLKGDQYYNVRRMAAKGYGLEMDVHDFSVDALVENALEVISNPSYKRRIAAASQIFRADPQRPTEKAVWWVEHVIRFGGEHLRSAGSELAWFQYWMLDVLGVIVLVGISALWGVWWVGRAVVRKCCGTKKAKEGAKLD